MLHILEFVEDCCKDVRIDSDVVEGIADIVGNYQLENQYVDVPDINGHSLILLPTQHSVDLICGKLTMLYRDAVLRRVNMKTLFRITEDKPLLEHSSMNESFTWLFQQDAVSDDSAVSALSAPS